MSRKNSLVLLELGPLPVDIIEATLGIEVELGPVVFTVSNQKHALNKHPEDFGRCLPHIGTVVAKPTYLRDDFKNHGKIELISRVPALGNGLLIAVEIIPDEQGRYRVASMYPISDKKIDQRRGAGTLKIAKGKAPQQAEP
ncbi:hypothetical protein J2847_006465 [Azospirillum agricola]|uniref:PBECR3 domain-containing polyvalent protein n=1 Tax=Azospirillum agricola TaxID=1720247 RepID=UPI001AE84D31|nr:hypothetical protein [Azospirillum agricola]MBP2233130.1 hypothetical protein [Azospirillum agricola]